MNTEKQTTQIVQFKLFDEFCERFPQITPMARLMRYQLQVIFAREYWPEKLRINNAWFRFKLGMSEKESDKRLFNRIRKELADRKLITFQPGKRGKDPEYSLNYLTDTGEYMLMATEQS